MIRVLVADSNLDSHELIHDILQINFRDAQIDRAHNCESFLSKVSNAESEYNLILYSIQMEFESGKNLLPELFQNNPQLLKRMVLMTENFESSLDPSLQWLPKITKPYSLDYFGEVIKKTCAH
jgi:DNA-binding NtrC family response regulator